jgi:hypothetical protein
MFEVGDLVQLEEKMAEVLRMEEDIIGVIVEVLPPIAELSTAYVIRWMEDPYPPGVLPSNVRHGFSDIESDPIFYNHELILIEGKRGEV